eukprot:2557911-Pyramimonas_sp.AAC.1
MTVTDVELRMRAQAAEEMRAVQTSHTCRLSHQAGRRNEAGGKRTHTHTWRRRKAGAEEEDEKEEGDDGEAEEADQEEGKGRRRMEDG